MRRGKSPPPPPEGRGVRLGSTYINFVDPTGGTIKTFPSLQSGHSAPIVVRHFFRAFSRADSCESA